MAQNEQEPLLYGGKHDVHAQSPSPNYDGTERHGGGPGIADPEVSQRQEQPSGNEAEEEASPLPPKRARTDPGRGTGELGFEQVDTDRPLSE
jgi:hypothetical protein